MHHLGSLRGAPGHGDRHRTPCLSEPQVPIRRSSAPVRAGDRERALASCHQERNYPVKQRSDFDRGLPDGIEDTQYLEILAADLDTIESRFEPQLVRHLAGVDRYKHGQLGGSRLTRAGLELRDRDVFDRFWRHGIPIAVLLAGGYARTPEETSVLHVGTVRTAEAACVA